MTKTLETADVAVTDGGPLGAGVATRTMTLADLRVLEESGRALWFEASADPRTGLRKAVPAVAARWRDPADLVLVVAPAAPLPGEYPTLEALLAAPVPPRYSCAGWIGAAGLGALETEASDAALAARREGWLKLKLNAWGFALSSGAVEGVYLNEDEFHKAATAAARSEGVRRTAGASCGPIRSRWDSRTTGPWSRCGSATWNESPLGAAACRRAGSRRRRSRWRRTLGAGSRVCSPISRNSTRRPRAGAWRTLRDVVRRAARTFLYLLPARRGELDRSLHGPDGGAGPRPAEETAR